MRSLNWKLWKLDADPMFYTLEKSKITNLLKQENSFHIRAAISTSGPVSFGTKLGMIMGGASDRPFKQTVKLLAKLIVRHGRID
jgi:hypothetical protein